MANKTFTIAVDFDGTCVEEDFPRVGRDIFGAVIALKKMVADGHRIILWTCREHSSFDGVEDTLQLAIDWFQRKGIPLFAVNGNPEVVGFPISRKMSADILIDDHSLGLPVGDDGLPDWFRIYQLVRQKQLDCSAKSAI